MGDEEGTPGGARDADADRAEAADDSTAGMGPWDSTVHARERGVDDDTGDGTESSDADEEGKVAGTLSPDLPVEPERPAPANVVFVIAGAYVGVLAIAALVGSGGRFGLTNYVAITAGFLVFVGFVYGFLVRGNPDT